MSPPQRCPVTKGVNAINKDSVCWFSYEAQHPLKLVQEEKHVLQGLNSLSSLGRLMKQPELDFRNDPQTVLQNQVTRGMCTGSQLQI